MSKRPQGVRFARAATTANITLSGTQTVDGVSLSIADRVLVKNQTTGANNGLYVVQSGDWERTVDANTEIELLGILVFVSEGTANGNKLFAHTTDEPLTLGTTALTFAAVDTDTGAVVGSTTPTTIQPDDAASAGASAEAARADHRHAIVAAAPSNIGFANTEGGSTSFARADHTHALVLTWKNTVRAATTANITLSGEQTIDGVSVVANDRVLVKDQSAGAENGIYVAASGAWSRATDADASAKLTTGAVAVVSEGTAGADTVWLLTTNDAITLDTTALTFAKIGVLNPYGVSGTDVAVADGGTGSSTAAGARSNLGAAASGANLDIVSVGATGNNLDLGAYGSLAWRIDGGLAFTPIENGTRDLGNPTMRVRDVYATTLRTGSADTNTLKLEARDVDGAAWTTFATLTAANEPTMDLSTAVTQGGAAIYRSGGTDVALADGGTGASLADPNADRILFWDDSAGAMTWLTAGSGLTITDTTMTASGGNYILVEAKTVTSNSQTQTFSSLNGDTDKMWEVVAQIENADASNYSTITLKPNGVTTNQNTTYTLSDDGVNSASTTALITVARLIQPNGGDCFFRTKIWAATTVNSVAKRRYFLTQAIVQEDGRSGYVLYAIWDEQATNITSLDVHSDRATGIGNGSQINLYKITSS